MGKKTSLWKWYNVAKPYASNITAKALRNTRRPWSEYNSSGHVSAPLSELDRWKISCEKYDKELV